MTDKPELRALTGIRGIAAWFVVLYHIRLSIAGLPSGALAVFAKGYLAVDFFFLLSGFVLWLTYGARLRGGGTAAAAHFLKRRVARIWPLHLFVLGGAVALALLLAATGRHDPAEFPFGELPLHVLLIQNWGLTDRLSWNDPAWSISAELAAYLLFPAFVALVDWRKVPVAGVVAAVVALLLALHGVMVVSGAPTLGQDITHLGLVRCLFEFAAGTGICALWLRWAATPLPAAMTGLLLGIAIGAATIAGFLPETLGAPAAFAALLLFLALTCGMRGNVLDSRVIHYLGEVSYATYLGHFLLWKLFKLAFVRDAYHVGPLLIGLYLVAVLLSSIALYHLIERPAQRRINRWHKKKGAEQPQPLRP